MPVWAELVAIMLAAYGAGFAIGWRLWGRAEETRQEDKR